VSAFQLFSFFFVLRTSRFALCAMRFPPCADGPGPFINKLTLPDFRRTLTLS
jgi:hypothetical protein